MLFAINVALREYICQKIGSENVKGQSHENTSLVNLLLAIFSVIVSTNFSETWLVHREYFVHYNLIYFQVRMQKVKVIVRQNRKCGLC